MAKKLKADDVSTLGRVTPEMDLEDNRELQGTATWEGLLLGFFGVSPIAGDTRFEVNLESMRGVSSSTTSTSSTAAKRPILGSQQRHQGVAGSFDRDGIQGVFGTLRE